MQGGVDGRRRFGAGGAGGAGPRCDHADIGQKRRKLPMRAGQAELCGEGAVRLACGQPGGGRAAAQVVLARRAAGRQPSGRLFIL